MTAPQEMVEQALAAADTDGCVVLVHVTSETNLRWARNTLTTNGQVAASSVAVTAMVGPGRQAACGSESASGLDLESVRDTVRAASGLARESGPASDAWELVSAGPASPDWDQPPGETSSAVFETLAPALGELFGSAEAEGREHFGFASHSIVTTYLGTSTGVRLRHVQPEARLELTAKSHARTRSAWAGAAAPDFAGLDLAGIDAGLRRRLDWQARTVDVPAGRHPALLSPSAVSDLMIDLYWSALGRDAAEGRSVFSAPGGGTRLGERLGSESVRLHSDPALAGLECAPFVAASASSAAASVFDCGLPAPAVDWVADGRLAALITTRAIAADNDLPVRPVVDNLRLDVREGRGDLDSLVERTERGLLVTCLWYNRVVDPRTLLLTGLTRDGVYLVEGGEVVGAAPNFRFNDSPVSLLSRIVDSGATERTLAREMGDYFHRSAMPPLLVSDFNFSTVSQAS